MDAHARQRKLITGRGKCVWGGDGLDLGKMNVSCNSAMICTAHKEKKKMVERGLELKQCSSYCRVFFHSELQMF